MSWIAVNWKISSDSQTLICYARSITEEKRIVLNFPCLDTIIIDIPQSAGTPEENIATLSEVYSTSHVKHLSTSFYKVTCAKEFIKSIKSDTVRSLYIVPTTVYAVLNAAGLSYDQCFDNDGKAVDTPPNSRAEAFRKTIVWDLEVMIPRHAGFPSSQMDPIIMTSFCSSDDEKKVGIYTTIDKKYLVNKLPGIDLTIFATELQLCEATLERLCEHDLDISYNGIHFDWPYLINRLLILKSPKIHSLGDVKNVVVDSGRGLDYVISFDGPSNHIDMLPFARAAYSQFNDHKLNTVTTNLLGIGKTGFSISKIRDITEQTQRNAEPTQELKDLVTTLVEYSAKDAEITQSLWNTVKSTYEYIVSQTNIPFSQVGSGEEVTAILLKINPELLNDSVKAGKRIPSSYMTKGFYKNLNMYSITNLLTQAMINSDDETTKKYGMLLNKSFPHIWIVSELFEHPRLKPKQIPEIDGTIGFSAGYVYITNKSLGIPLVIYTTFIVISTGSWIIKNAGDSRFSYHGISAVTRHPFKAVTRAVEKYVNETIEGRSPTDLSLFVSELGAMDITDITMSSKVTSLNINKYDALINETQKGALLRSETPSITIEYIQVLENGIRTLKRLNQITQDVVVDAAYYASEILKILKKIP